MTIFEPSRAFFDPAAMLIDLDGTLVDSTPAILRGWDRWALSRGLSLAQLEPLIYGRTAEATMSLAEPDRPRLDIIADAAVLVAAQIDDVDDVVALPGALALAQALDGTAWAVVTACSRALAYARLDAAGLPRPPVLITSEDTTVGKPDPEGYLTAAARLRTQPQRCLVLEDAPSGIAAARAAKVPVIAVATTTDPAALREATVIIPDLTYLSFTRPPVPARGIDTPSATVGDPSEGSLHVTARTSEEFGWSAERR